MDLFLPRLLELDDVPPEEDVVEWIVNVGEDERLPESLLSSTCSNRRRAYSACRENAVPVSWMWNGISSPSPNIRPEGMKNYTAR